MRRRLVRLHLDGNQPSLEGVLVGWPRFHAGHYVVRSPKLIEGEDKTHALDGKAIWVPQERVVFCQELR